MPTFGEEKRRDMARSVLPSSRRKGARWDKRHVHHRVRTRLRNLIAQENWDDESDLLIDPQRAGRYWGIKVVVRDRREADNVGPIMRWAEANADKMGDTPQERYAKMRAMLPPNLVGWHAMTHIDNIEAYDTNPNRWGSFQSWRARRAEERRDAFNEVVEVAESVLHNGGAVALNIELRKAARQYVGLHVDSKYDSSLKKLIESKYVCDWCGNPRLLLGQHDIEDFATEIVERAFRRGSYGRSAQHREALDVIRVARQRFLS